MTELEKRTDAKSPGVADVIRSSIAREHVDSTVREYLALHGDTADERRLQYAGVVNRYYDLVTDFFEYGWGKSYHFAPRFRDETFRESVLRLEYRLAHRLALGPGMQVLDAGCGIGGPMRNIARFSGCDVLGINNNAYQVSRAEELNRAESMTARCRVIHGDFMSIPLPDNTVDAAYAIEATLHAPSWVGVFSEIRRVLKPGARFAFFDWCTTAGFDPANPDHVAIKRGIERGNGIPDLGTIPQLLGALSDAGFEVLDHTDAALEGDIPWYEPLSPSTFSFATFRSSVSGRKVTNTTVKALELMRIVPKGAAAVAVFLDQAAQSLTAGGRSGIFTPMYFTVAQKRQSP